MNDLHLDGERTVCCAELLQLVNLGRPGEGESVQLRSKWVAGWDDISVSAEYIVGFMARLRPGGPALLPCCPPSKVLRAPPAGVVVVKTQRDQTGSRLPGNIYRSTGFLFLVRAHSAPDKRLCGCERFAWHMPPSHMLVGVGDLTLTARQRPHLSAPSKLELDDERMTCLAA